MTGALKGTGLRTEGVDFVIDSGSDFIEGRRTSNCGFLGAMGTHHKEESRVEEDSLWSFSYAANKIVTARPRSDWLLRIPNRPKATFVHTGPPC